MKKRINTLTAIILTITLVSDSGCKKSDSFFELPDTGGIDADIWDTDPAIQLFLNRAYYFIMPTFPYEYTGNSYSIHLASDESYFSATDANARKALGMNGFLMSNDPRYAASKYQGNNLGDNRYYDIDRCNRAIQNIPLGTVLSQDAKNKYLGQFYTLRALAYFGLTKVYGGMPLVLEPQNPDHLTLEGRVPAREMFKSIVGDLDSSIKLLNGVEPADVSRGKITKSAAAALKARALLYWASPQFNPLNDPKHPYQQLRWDTAFTAAKEAYEICLAAGRALVPNYADIFRIEGGNTEAILVRSYSVNPGNANGSNNVEAKVRPASESGSPNDAFYPSIALVNAYNMIDGTPISKSSDYDTLLFWKNRDPRFEASIAYNGCIWQLSGKKNRRQWTYDKAVGDNGTNESGLRGFYNKRFSSPDLPAANVVAKNGGGGNGMDWIEVRFAEVILNYAETANETNNLTLAKDLVRQIRKRAGVIPGASDYGLALATNKEQMRDLLENERMVEFAFEAKRNDDLRRLRKMQSLTGTLEAMVPSVNNAPLPAKADAYLTLLNSVVDPSTGKRYRDNLDMNNKDTLKKYFSYTIISPNGNGGYSVPEYYYFYSLNSQFLQSTPLLEQTIGWDAGMFDPLD